MTGESTKTRWSRRGMVIIERNLREMCEKSAKNCNQSRFWIKNLGKSPQKWIKMKKSWRNRKRCVYKLLEIGKNQQETRRNHLRRLKMTQNVTDRWYTMHDIVLKWINFQLKSNLFSIFLNLNAKMHRYFRSPYRFQPNSPYNLLIINSC